MARVAEFIGGPADGFTVALKDDARDGCVQTLPAPGKTADGRPTFAIYRLEGGRFRHMGRTDENVPMVARACQCASCSLEVEAVMPEVAEYPLECARCHRMMVWPKR